MTVHTNTPSRSPAPQPPSPRPGCRVFIRTVFPAAATAALGRRAPHGLPRRAPDAAPGLLGIFHASNHCHRRHRSRITVCIHTYETEVGGMSGRGVDNTRHIHVNYPSRSRKKKCKQITRSHPHQMIERDRIKESQIDVGAGSCQHSQCNLVHPNNWILAGVTGIMQGEQ